MSVKRNIVANYGGQLATAALGLAFVPLYIRYLGIEAYGLVGFFAVLQVWLSVLDAGMTPTLAREMARFSSGHRSVSAARDLLFTLTVLALIGAVTIAVATAAGADFISRSWFAQSTIAPHRIALAIVIIALILALRFCESLQRGALIGLQHQVWLNGANVVLGILRSGGVVAVLALFSPTIEAFFLWNAFISALSLLTFVRKAWQLLPAGSRRARFSTVELRGIRVFAGGMFGISILALLLTQVDKILLSRILPLEDFGYYMLAATAASAIFMVVSPITQAVYPLFVGLVERDAEAELRESYHRFSQIMTFVVGPAALTLAAFPRSVLFAWTGNADIVNAVAPLLTFLVLGNFFNALVTLPHQLQLAHGWTRLSLWSNVVAVFIIVPLILLIVPDYGPVAAAALFMALNLGYLLVQIPIMHRRILRRSLRKWYVQDVAVPLGGVLTIVWLGRLLLTDAGTDRVAGLALVITMFLMSAAVAAMCSPAIRTFVAVRVLSTDSIRKQR